MITALLSRLTHHCENVDAVQILALRRQGRSFSITGTDDGDPQMVTILRRISGDGLTAVEAACQEALVTASVRPK